MRDYQITVLGLASPPTAAYRTTYRPAVQVRNDGLHDADIGGQLRVYSAGRMVFSTTLALSALAPGQTGNAQAADYLTFEHDGAYNFQADITADRTPTVSLPPTNVNVAGEPPTPPTPVTAHAIQHEHGGSDEVSVSGLQGKLADPQTPTTHAASHMIDGDDQISVESLQGKLADPQTPTTHGNERHVSEYATADGMQAIAAAAVEAHDEDQGAHQNSTVLEHSANKEIPGGYCGLTPTGVPGLTPNQVDTTHLLIHSEAVSAHSLAVNLEKTANKGAADGYCPLDDSALVPAENLSVDPSLLPSLLSLQHLTSVPPSVFIIELGTFDDYETDCIVQFHLIARYPTGAHHPAIALSPDFLCGGSSILNAPMTTLGLLADPTTCTIKFEADLILRPVAKTALFAASISCVNESSTAETAARIGHQCDFATLYAPLTAVVSVMLTETDLDVLDAYAVRTRV